jgi:hypothetical protein
MLIVLSFLIVASIGALWVFAYGVKKIIIKIEEDLKELKNNKKH